MVPQPETALIDPFPSQPTLTMICNIQDPITHQDYTRDPRNIARKALSYMRNTGLADQCLMAPELEFFVFDNVRFEQRGHEAFYHVDSVEGAWNRGRAAVPNLGYKPGLGAGLFSLPADRQPGGYPLGDGPAHGRMRHRHGGPLPRGRHRRPVRDRPGARIRSSKVPTR